MRSLVVYESMYGNTREIADSIARGLSDLGPVDVTEVGETLELPEDLDLLVAGGPTHAFGMSREATRADAASKPHEGEIVSRGIGLREWIEALPRTARPLAAATFDTRVRHPRLPGSAAKAAGRALKAHGYRMVSGPETFDVEGMTGPLCAGESERAASWARSLAKAVHPVG